MNRQLSGFHVVLCILCVSVCNAGLITIPMPELQGLYEWPEMTKSSYFDLFLTAEQRVEGISLFVRGTVNPGWQMNEETDKFTEVNTTIRSTVYKVETYVRELKSEYIVSSQETAFEGQSPYSIIQRDQYSGQYHIQVYLWSLYDYSIPLHAGYPAMNLEEATLMVNIIPEPASLLLLGFGWMWIRKRNQSRQ
jgi:hypothetical protein